MDVKKYLLHFKKQFDLKLDQFLTQKQKSATQLAPGFEQAVGEIRRLNKAGGKRIRPAMIYAGFKACGGKDNKAIWQACMAMELIQSFALLHDDIMDDAQERRGEITCFKKLGLNKAILAGDVALILADELIPTGAEKYFYLMKWELTAGQWLDIDENLESRVQNSEFNLESRRLKTLELKTAMYAIARPLQIGAALGRASVGILKAFFEYGKNVGIAFQMKDDLLDAEISNNDLEKYLQKAVNFSQKGKKAIKDVKIRQKEKQFLLDLTEYVVKRSN